MVRFRDSLVDTFDAGFVGTLVRGAAMSVVSGLWGSGGLRQRKIVSSAVSYKHI